MPGGSGPANDSNVPTRSKQRQQRTNHATENPWAGRLIGRAAARSGGPPRGSRAAREGGRTRVAAGTRLGTGGQARRHRAHGQAAGLAGAGAAAERAEPAYREIKQLLPESAFLDTPVGGESC